MKQCQNCDFWGQQTSNLGIGLEHRECLNPKIAHLYAGESLEANLARKADGAILTDADLWNAKFFPGPDFGCLHFKSKT